MTRPGEEGVDLIALRAEVDARAAADLELLIAAARAALAERRGERRVAADLGWSRAKLRVLLGKDTWKN